MSDKLNIHFQVLQTSIRITYGDLTEFEADAVISTDDIYFSAASGVSQYISEKAGKPMIRRELQKSVPPSKPVGSVVVTSAGKLRAKYIFHVAVLGFRPINPYDLIQEVTKKVVDLANSLGIERIVTPLFLTHEMGLPEKPRLVSQLTGLPEVQVLDLVLRSLAYHLAITPEPVSLREVIIVLKDIDAESSRLGEQLIIGDLSDMDQEIEAWCAKLDTINKWAIYLKPLLAALQDSSEELFRKSVEQELNHVEAILSEIFTNIEKSKQSDGSIFNEKTIENAALTKETYTEQQKRLLATINAAFSEIEQNKEIEPKIKKQLENQLDEATAQLQTLGECWTRQQDTSLSMVGQAGDKSDKKHHRHGVKILFLAANPSDTTRLRLGDESRAIEEALNQSAFRGRFKFIQHHAVRYSDLIQLLLSNQPDIVHFSGHGSPSNEIVVEADDGSSHPISQSALSRLFTILKDNIRCVILNACFSEPQAKTIAEHIDCVIGVSQTIQDQAAINFASAFYLALGYGRDIRTAFDLGCEEIAFALNNLDESDKPQLITSTSDPTKIFLVNGH